MNKIIGIETELSREFLDPHDFCNRVAKFVDCFESEDKILYEIFNNSQFILGAQERWHCLIYVIIPRQYIPLKNYIVSRNDRTNRLFEVIFSSLVDHRIENMGAIAYIQFKPKMIFADAENIEYFIKFPEVIDEI
jgi:hypothetical protein